MEMQEVIKEAVDTAVEETNKQFEKKIEERLGEFGMVKDKKDSIAKFFTAPQTANEKMGSLQDDKMTKGHAFARFAKMKLQHKMLGTSQPLHEYIAETAEKHYSHNRNF